MHMRNRHPFDSPWATFCALFLALVSFTPVHAQQSASATLEGIVTDPQGAVIANAKLTIKNTAKGLTRELQTDETGVYRFAALQPGAYELTIGAPNFSETKRSGIVLTVGQKLNLDVTLAVGGATATVNITAEAPIVETTRTNVAGSVGERQVSSLPVNGRNFLDFATLTAGVVRGPRQGWLFLTSPSPPD